MGKADDDDFNWNYGISLAASGGFKEAEEVLHRIKDSSFKKEPSYNAWLARCLIMNKKPEGAWKIYLSGISIGETATSQLLQVIANDCYRLGYFLVAAKAFDALREIDNDNESLKGIMAACVGFFRRVVIASKEQGKYSFSDYDVDLSKAIDILKKNEGTEEVQEIISVLNQWTVESTSVG